MTLKLVVFDVDGTLVDSQNDIVSCMRQAFAAADISAPGAADILATVGLSLPETMKRLAPDAGPSLQSTLVDAYKHCYAARRRQVGSAQSSPLFPGALDALKRLHAIPEILLGIATGKSKRGLDSLLDAHALRPLFVTTQNADGHPSKPNPSMLLAALAETGVEPENAIMVGDSSFDMDMARGAAMRCIAVSWGYQPVDQLAADIRIDHFDALMPAVTELLGELS